MKVNLILIRRNYALHKAGSRSISQLYALITQTLKIEYELDVCHAIIHMFTVLDSWCMRKAQSGLADIELLENWWPSQRWKDSRMLTQTIAEIKESQIEGRSWTPKLTVCSCTSKLLAHIFGFFCLPCRSCRPSRFRSDRASVIVGFVKRMTWTLTNAVTFQCGLVVFGKMYYLLSWALEYSFLLVFTILGY